MKKIINLFIFSSILFANQSFAAEKSTIASIFNNIDKNVDISVALALATATLAGLIITIKAIFKLIEKSKNPAAQGRPLIMFVAGAFLVCTSIFINITAITIFTDEYLTAEKLDKNFYSQIE